MPDPTVEVADLRPGKRR